MSNTFSLDSLGLDRIAPEPTVPDSEVVTIVLGAQEHQINYSLVSDKTYKQMFETYASTWGFSAERLTLRREFLEDDEDDDSDPIVDLNNLVSPGIYNCNIGIDSKGISASSL